MKLYVLLNTNPEGTNLLGIFTSKVKVWHAKRDYNLEVHSNMRKSSLGADFDETMYEWDSANIYECNVDILCKEVGAMKRIC